MLASRLYHSTMPVDVAIIGGGIAGMSLALVLRRSGLDVAVIEREPVFRDRIRGELIHAWGVREIDGLGLRPVLEAAGALSLPFWTKYRNAEPDEPYAWASDFPGNPVEIGVNHVDLQNTLVDAATAEGVRVFRPATATPRLAAGGWNLDIEHEGGPSALTASLLVGADGRRSATRRLLGGTATLDPVHHQLGGMLVRGVDLPSGSVHQAYHDAGFSLTVLQSGDRARVYYACPTDEARELQRQPGTAEYLDRVAALHPDGAFRRAEPAGPLGFFPNADLVSDRISGERAVLIGDAAGASDPSQGHGLSLVYRDVRVLRDLIAGGSMEDVPERFGALRRGYFSVVRRYAQWAAPLMTATGEEADALREQVTRAREADPTAGGFAGILVTGPDGLSVDERTRAHFFGEDLPGATVFGYPRHVAPDA